MRAAKRLYRSRVAGRRDGPLALLGSINEDIARGDWTLFFSFPDAIEKATPRDVSRVVKRYLTDENKSTIGYFVGTKAERATRPKMPAAKRSKKVTRRRPAFRMPRAARKTPKKAARRR
jgi:predicted Zn-dependent peptidase